MDFSLFDLLFCIPLILKEICMYVVDVGWWCIISERVRMVSLLKIKKNLMNKNQLHLSCVGGSAPVVSAVAVVTCSPQRWQVEGPLLGNRANAGHPPWHRPLGHVLRKEEEKPKSFNPKPSFTGYCEISVQVCINNSSDTCPHDHTHTYTYIHIDSPCHKGQPRESKREPSWLSW